MRTMVMGIALMAVITAAGITGKAMVISTVTSTRVIGPEGMVVIRTMVGGGTADAETGSQPAAFPISQNKQATSSGGLFVWGSVAGLEMNKAGRFRP